MEEGKTQREGGERPPQDPETYSQSSSLHGSYPKGLTHTFRTLILIPKQANLINVMLNWKL